MRKFVQNICITYLDATMDVCGIYSLEYQFFDLCKVYKVCGPQYPNYGFKKLRVDSFYGYYWKKYCPVSKNELVDAGFFNLHRKDFVCCFFCGIQIGEWESTDNPWIEHEKHSTNCVYLKLNNNILEEKKNLFTSDANKFIGIWINSDSDIVEELFALGISLPTIKNLLAKRYQSSKMMFVSLDEALECLKNELEENNIIKSRISLSNLLCHYCNESEISVVFLPCGHLITCSKCALKFENCPKCKNNIKAVVNSKFN